MDVPGKQVVYYSSLLPITMEGDVNSVLAFELIKVARQHWTSDQAFIVLTAHAQAFITLTAQAFITLTAQAFISCVGLHLRAVPIRRRRGRGGQIQIIRRIKSLIF